jgi:hypothetical protein
MNSLIWRNLPSDLIRVIVLLSNPIIDTRLYFNIPPKKLSEPDAWKLWYSLHSHDGLVYNVTSKSLHILRIPECHIIRRPIELDATDEWFSIFNQDERAHTIETTTPRGTHVTTSATSFYTEMRVLLSS